MGNCLVSCSPSWYRRRFRFQWRRRPLGARIRRSPPIGAQNPAEISSSLMTVATDALAISRCPETELATAKV